ncbi:hypothetical protein CANTEDRAFT_136479 [Yamadazyma tenuis ATCC 10573]|uniref:PA14 domain-containing protein n=1 Tax=Candida tenuis (strain ATCC 10573 / BCRC 21748 / CBS 615 / JCM 9827 / NBRC 10315 / NRRL Y-1498 / VKM Y-70) TaxID=590646 RepID=G3BEZ3_CANTC|nr:uncharacterized protein CANTEDRAFT_136479 [Yamadazyma tenuis ATCC 10573]EGV59970.1 hypothetical protein CANTEDRAFT_136479 [Yamadazyma tenuis ATCC 10573]
MLPKLLLIGSLSLPLVLGYSGCSPPSTNSGLAVDYFDEVAFYQDSYAYLATIDGLTPDYTKYGVEDIDITITGIPDVSSATANSTTYYQDVYDRSTNVIKFGLRLSGYFRAPEDGTYTFAFTAAEDYISMNIGGASGDLDCCTNPNELSAAGAQIKANGTNTDYALSSASAKVQLKAGQYYPVKILYYNESPNQARMSFQVTCPNGTVATDDIPCNRIGW